MHVYLNKDKEGKRKPNNNIWDLSYSQRWIWRVWSCRM